MVMQVGKCDGCGFYDHLEFCDGVWLCKYCRETLEEDGKIELENGIILRREKK